MKSGTYFGMTSNSKKPILPEEAASEVVAIINGLIPWAGSELPAFEWFRSQPIPSFGDLTAEDLVHAGRGEAVMHYLSRIAEGGFA